MQLKNICINSNAAFKFVFNSEMVDSFVRRWKRAPMTMSQAISVKRRRTSPALIQRLILNFQSRLKVVLVMTIASCLTDSNALCCQEKTLTFFAQ